MNNILQIKELAFSYQTNEMELNAISNFNLNVKEGEFVAIVGPSGCGKTTILSLISGLLKPSSGEIIVNSSPTSLDSGEIGYMFQKDHLFEWRSIWKNVILGIEIQKKNKDIVKLEEIKELLKKYGLYDFKDRRPSELSGGMRQRVALIRTLALNPSLLLLDEPFSALDFQTRLKVCDDVSNILRKENKTAVLVTHDISEAISMADRIIILTQRPATIKRIVEIDLGKSDSPLKRRENAKFSKYFDEIWKELNDDKDEKGNT